MKDELTEPLKRFRIVIGHPNDSDEVEIYRYFISQREALKVFPNASLVEEVKR